MGVPFPESGMASRRSHGIVFVLYLHQHSADVCTCINVKEIYVIIAVGETILQTLRIIVRAANSASVDLVFRRAK